MKDQTNTSATRPATRKADDALDQLCNRGFTAFRNGKILSPEGYVVTEEDQKDFESVKAVYRHSKFI